MEEYKKFVECATPVILSNFSETIEEFRDAVGNIGKLDNVTIKLLQKSLFIVIEECQAVLDASNPQESLTISDVHDMMYLFYLSRFTFQKVIVELDIIDRSDPTVVTKFFSMLYCLVSIGAFKQVTVSTSQGQQPLLKEITDQIVEDSRVNNQEEIKQREAIRKLRDLFPSDDTSSVVVIAKNNREEIQNAQKLTIRFMNVFRGSKTDEGLFQKVSVDIKNNTSIEMSVDTSLDISMSTTGAPKTAPEKPIVPSTYEKLRGVFKKTTDTLKTLAAINKSILSPPPPPLLTPAQIKETTQQTIDQNEILYAKIESMTPFGSPMNIVKEEETKFTEQIQHLDTQAVVETNTRIHIAPNVLSDRLELKQKIARKQIIGKRDMHKDIETFVESYVMEYNINAISRDIDEIDPIETGMIAIALCEQLEITTYDRFDYATNAQVFHNNIVKAFKNLFSVDMARVFSSDMTLVCQEVIDLADKHTKQMYANAYAKINAPQALYIVGPREYRHRVAMILLNFIIYNADSQDTLDTIMYTYRIALLCPTVDIKTIDTAVVLGEGTYGKVTLYNYEYENKINLQRETTVVAAKIFKYEVEEVYPHIYNLSWILSYRFEEAMRDLMYTFRANKFLPIDPKTFRNNYEKYTNIPFHDVMTVYDTKETKPGASTIQIAILLPQMTGSVQKLVSNGYLPLKDRLSIMYQMTTCVELFNTVNGSLHGDLKPDNFLYIDISKEKTMTATGVEVLTYANSAAIESQKSSYRVYLADFGLVHPLRELRQDTVRPNYSNYSVTDEHNQNNVISDKAVQPLLPYVKASIHKPTVDTFPKTYAQLERDQEIYTSPYRPTEVFRIKYHTNPEKYLRGYHNFTNDPDLKNYNDSAQENHRVMQNADIYALLINFFAVNRDNRTENFYSVYYTTLIEQLVDSDLSVRMTGNQKDKTYNFPDWFSYIYTVREELLCDIATLQREKNKKKYHEIELSILQFLLVHVNMSPWFRPSFITIKEFLLSLIVDFYKAQATTADLNTTTISTFGTKAEITDDKDDEKYCVLI